MDMITVTAKTVDEAVTKALIELETTSDKLEYEVVDKGSNHRGPASTTGNDEKANGRFVR